MELLFSDEMKEESIAQIRKGVLFEITRGVFQKDTSTTKISFLIKI